MTKIRISDVDSSVSVFAGPLKNRETGAQKMCEICNTERAMWIHKSKSEDGNGKKKNIYLCFGCGRH